MEKKLSVIDFNGTSSSRSADDAVVADSARDGLGARIRAAVDWRRVRRWIRLGGMDGSILVGVGMKCGEPNPEAV